MVDDRSSRKADHTSSRQKLIAGQQIKLDVEGRIVHGVLLRLDVLFVYGSDHADQPIKADSEDEAIAIVKAKYPNAFFEGGPAPRASDGAYPTRYMESEPGEVGLAGTSFYRNESDVLRQEMAIANKDDYWGGDIAWVCRIIEN
jgi:hypothetical protein